MGQKIQLIMELRLVEGVYDNQLNLVDVDATRIHAVIKVGEIMSSIGLQILSFWDREVLSKEFLNNAATFIKW